MNLKIHTSKELPDLQEEVIFYTEDETPHKGIYDNDCLDIATGFIEDDSGVYYETEEIKYWFRLPLLDEIELLEQKEAEK